MRKIILLKGLPASGKTTWAKQMLKDNPGIYKRVNKDDLRAMLDNGVWSKRNEQFVLNVRDFIVSSAIRDGVGVIVDDTNLEPKHEERMKEMAEILGSALQIKEFDIDVEECLKRDSAREKPVGEEVIGSMHSKYKALDVEPIVQNPTAPPVILCDIDGTLAIRGERGPFDWHRVKEDKLNIPVEDILFQYEYSAKVILLSGRDSVCRKETEEWLEEKGVRYEKLLMRAEGDKRPDYVVKKELFDAHVKDKYRVLFVLDDRLQVVKLWRAMGLTCLQVAEGYF